MHEVNKEKKGRGGSGSDFVFLDGEGKRRGSNIEIEEGGEEAADDLIELLQGGCGAAPRFDVGLGRRNNELNELTNCGAEGGGGNCP